MAYQGEWIPPGTPITIEQLEWLAQACNTRFGTSYTFTNGQWLTTLELVAGKIVKSLSHPSPLISGGSFDNRLKAINTSLTSIKTRQNQNVVPSFGFQNLLHPISLSYQGGIYFWPVRNWQYGGVGQNVTEAFADNLHIFSFQQTLEVKVRNTGAIVETSNGIPCSNPNFKTKFLLSGLPHSQVYLHRISTSPIARKDCGIYDPNISIISAFGYRTAISRSSYIVGSPNYPEISFVYPVNPKAYYPSIAGEGSDVLENVPTTCINQVASYADVQEQPFIIGNPIYNLNNYLIDSISISIPKVSSTNRTFVIFSNGKSVEGDDKKKIAELTIPAGQRTASATACLPVIEWNHTPFLTIEGDMEDSNNPYISAHAYGIYVGISGSAVVDNYIADGFMLLKEDGERLDLGLQLSFGPLSAHLFNELANLVQS